MTTTTAVHNGMCPTTPRHWGPKVPREGICINIVRIGELHGQAQRRRQTLAGRSHIKSLYPTGAWYQQLREWYPAAGTERRNRCSQPTTGQAKPSSQASFMPGLFLFFVSGMTIHDAREQDKKKCLPRTLDSSGSTTKPRPSSAEVVPWSRMGGAGLSGT